MMYMPDAIRATLELMDAPAERIRERHGYNLAGVSFTPDEIAAAIADVLPGFAVDYAPDFRQAIADSWPRSIDDSAARADWGWKPEFDLRAMVGDMLANLAPTAPGGACPRRGPSDPWGSRRADRQSRIRARHLIGGGAARA
jgi:nucleoside-diphosphate-sugar epimerase